MKLVGWGKNFLVNVHNNNMQNQEIEYNFFPLYACLMFIQNIYSTFSKFENFVIVHGDLPISRNAPFLQLQIATETELQWVD